MKLNGYCGVYAPLCPSFIGLQPSYMCYIILFRRVFAASLASFWLSLYCAIIILVLLPVLGPVSFWNQDKENVASDESYRTGHRTPLGQIFILMNKENDWPHPSNFCHIEARIQSTFKSSILFQDVTCIPNDYLAMFLKPFLQDFVNEPLHKTGRNYSMPQGKVRSIRQ